MVLAPSARLATTLEQKRYPRNDTCDLPHLTLDKVQALNVRVVHAMERDGMWPPWVVGGVFLLADELGPDIAIAVQSPGAVALNADVVPA